ncbi:MAG: hypothetical protein AAFZ07_11620 [Actinomycetota bacterium]
MRLLLGDEVELRESEPCGVERDVWGIHATSTRPTMVRHDTELNQMVDIPRRGILGCYSTDQLS